MPAKITLLVDAVPFAFTSTVKKALVDITGEAVEDKAAQLRVYLARQ